MAHLMVSVIWHWYILPIYTFISSVVGCLTSLTGRTQTNISRGSAARQYPNTENLSRKKKKNVCHGGRKMRVFGLS